MVYCNLQYCNIATTQANISREFKRASSCSSAARPDNNRKSFSLAKARFWATVVMLPTKRIRRALSGAPRRLVGAFLVLSLLPFPASGWVAQQQDWLVNPNTPKPTAVDTSVPGRLTLGNGILARSFALSPCFGTVELMRTDVQQTFLRGMSPEAIVSLNGTTFNVGGCVSAQSNPQQFDPSKPLSQDPLAWSYVSYSTSAPVAAYPWSPSQRYAPPTAVWPPRGLHLAVTFGPPAITPDPSSQTFTTLPAFHFGCPADAPSSSGACLTGWPTCDNSSVPGQCSWPRAAAQANCQAWAACQGVNCADGRADCQARGAGSVLAAGAGATAIVRTSSSAGAFAGTSVVVNYEMYDGVPLIRKWLSVAVAAGPSASSPVVVFDTGTIEILRSPNYAPSLVTVIQVQANNPSPFFQQTVPDPLVASAGTTQQLWFTDALWDAPNDNELHVPYTIYTVLSVGYSFDVTCVNHVRSLAPETHKHAHTRTRTRTHEGGERIEGGGGVGGK